MKKLTQSFLVITLALAGALAQAHPAGFGHGYPRSYGYEGHGGGWHRGGWVAPVVAAGLIGSAIYASTHPLYAPNYVNPPVVINPAPVYMNGVPGVAAPVAYYCPAYQQYYPQVGTCPVPWQIVN
jgi:hypothetical protein